jgi:hypothetical protein
MFVDLSGFILRWRMANAPRRYPSEPEMRDYLILRGWKATKGGDVTIRTVQEMMVAMTDGEDVFPPANLDRIASNAEIALSGTEIATVAIDPKAWAAYCEEVRDGWKPSWRDQTLHEKDDADRLQWKDDLLRQIQSKATDT